MDILRPSLLWIDGRCYRQNCTETSTDTQELELVSSFENESNSCQPDEVCDAQCEIQIKNGVYTTTIDIPSALCGHIVGAKGVTKKRIESETRTKIRVPFQGKEGPTVITGSNQRAVSKARNRVEMVASSARNRHPFTHFLSIPLVGTSVIQNFHKFKEEVIQNCDRERGISSNIFQNSKKLHLTIGTLVLLNDQERKKASDVLNDCAEKIIKPLLGNSPLKVDIKGIEYMNDDPAEVDVLYAKVTPKEKPERLQNLADQLVEHFAGEGLMTKEYDQVKLHATIMNSLFENEQQEMASSGSRGRPSFDVRKILKLFRDYDFGEYQITTIHISQRHSTDKHEGYYSATAKLSI